MNFGIIEREVSRKYLDCFVPRNDGEGQEGGSGLLDREAPGNDGARVLIVGSGPAGLALSYYLAKQGFKVTVYEKEAQFGGMLRYGIPGFRLDKTLIDKVVAVIGGMGVVLKNNTAADIDNIEKYKENFDTVVLAVGAGVSKSLDIEGAQFAVQALQYLKTPKKAKKVIVIGAGNVAIDCALTAAHLGAETVDLCYRRDEAAMKAYPEELVLARDAGINFHFFMVPEKITKKKRSIEVMFNCKGENVMMQAGLVITAIGQTAVPAQLTNNVLSFTSSGLIKADDFKTNIKGVYALGDAVTGPGTIIKAVAAARQLAEVLCESD